MKKIYTALFVATAALFTACTNDEIEIVSSETVVTVNTSKVMDYAGMKELAASNTSFFDADDLYDLQTLGSSYRLRIRNLVYNEKGNLVADEATLARTYTNNIKNRLALPTGNYTLVTLADVVGVDGDENINFRFWSLSDSTNIETAKVTDTGRIGLQYKILSATINHIVISDQDHSYNVDPEPIGSLVYLYNANIHSKSNVEELHFSTKKTEESVTFSNSSVVRNFETSTRYSWVYDRLKVANFTANNVYSYAFIFADDATPVAFQYSDQNDYLYTVAEGIVRFEAGAFYYAYVDVSTYDDNEPTCYLGKASDYLAAVQSYSRPLQMPLPNKSDIVAAKKNTSSMRLMDINKKIRNK